MTLKAIAKRVLRPVLSRIEFEQLPEAAKAEHRRDERGLQGHDPGIDAVLEAGVAWLCLAQDSSPDADGGFSRHYSLVSGWGRSYPETSGYIVPTLIDLDRRGYGSSLEERARRTLDWFVRIQFEDGGFQGGMIGSEPRVPVTFNTGQILLGLVAGFDAFGDVYRDSMNRAARWLRDSLDADGAWRRYPTPFANPGDKTYETHVAWGLLEADRVEPSHGYGEAALRNVDWALTKQRDNGWFENCCLDDPTSPLTHTMGYALRGILEAWRFTGERRYLDSALQCANPLLGLVSTDGWLPGQIDSSWRPAANWVCLTGSSQIAHCLLMLYQDVGDERFLDTGCALNRFVRRTVATDCDDERVRGGVKGAFPVSGDYGTYQYLNWAVKFTIDSNLLERSVTEAPA